jgi:hypothetical protein
MTCSFCSSFLLCNFVNDVILLCNSWIVCSWWAISCRGSSSLGFSFGFSFSALFDIVSNFALLSFQLKCSSNIDSIHYLRLTNSFHQVPRDIHTLPVKESIPRIWSFLVTSFLFMIG